MKDLDFYIPREKSTYLSRDPDGSAPMNGLITDLPGKETDPQRTPRDLPSPRHRPGEPILYDPPRGDMGTQVPAVDPTHDPLTGTSQSDPMRL